MTHKRKTLSFVISLAAGLMTLGLTGTASAQLTVLGDGFARQCYMKAKTGDAGRRASIDICQKALDVEAMSRKDRASTYVNLGILLMRAEKYELADAAYQEAVTLKPEITEIYINMSANAIYQGNPQKGLRYATKAIDLKTSKMPEAYFNRAMAYDALQNYNAAYHDLKKALELKPEWPPALRAIDNYEVVTKPKKTG